MTHPYIKTTALALSLLAIQASALAQPITGSERYVIAPACLLKQANFSYQSIDKQNDLSLIKTTSENIAALAEAKSRTTLCAGFIDVSSEWTPSTAATLLKKYSQTTNKTLRTSDAPTELRYAAEVTRLFSQIKPSIMWDDLTTLTSFQDRYANSDNGVKAAEWLKQTAETLAANNNRSDVTAYFVKTGNQYQQPSLVVKLGTSNGEGIVIGAHMDTLNGTFSKKPGADDDGSGSVTVLATLRTILESGMTFNKPIYFIWYAAEEEGLVGSQYVVKDFKNKHIPVESVLHFDLTGYAHRNEPTMYLIDDYVNSGLVSYLETLIKTYVKQPVKHTKCGYACSDHASWTQAGYKAAIPAESAYEDTNPDIHSSRDTMDNLSLNHMTDYLKLALSFAVESAEPTHSLSRR